jgi:hypothetical protein
MISFVCQPVRLQLTVIQANMLLWRYFVEIIEIHNHRAWCLTQVAEHLPTKLKALSSNPSISKKSISADFKGDYSTFSEWLQSIQLKDHEKQNRSFQMNEEFHMWKLI